MGTPMTEQEMRDADVPWLKTTDELVAYIEELRNQPHDYGTCVYAVSMAAVAAFRYMAGTLGITGFQASCADMDILTRTRHMKGPWMIIKGEDMLYPQYDLRGRLDEALSEWRSWASKEAKVLLADTNKAGAHPDVIAHWQKLAIYEHP